MQNDVFYGCYHDGFGAMILQIFGVQVVMICRLQVSVGRGIGMNRVSGPELIVSLSR